nr:leukocyte cysteine proteinase inhibitor 1-like isoform X2 [Misgurnus anguillicaudatus]XP_055053929.1 leukocyte cysteine proteinase inhibitor 1-like isoform X2 [Misgurnus anguillicaudatus]XP_055053930.1 leukocyte cysteine proteinase inhibitor 1-like isoform X2 [Misgurnus anguillicaudatus]
MGNSKAMVNAVWSPERDATPEIQEICDKMKPDACSSAGVIFADFTAIKYIFQFDNETQEMKYSIRVHVASGKYIHLEVTESSSKELKFIGCLYP